MTVAADRPLIWIGRADYARLLRSIDRLNEQAPDVSQFLSHELERAIVRPEADLPANMVRMGTRVLFARDDNHPMEWAALVFPDEAPAEGEISLATPVGAALLGLREGARMPYTDHDGQTRHISVQRVLPV